MIIAIDGTTASGKGTIARRLAALYTDSVEMLLRSFATTRAAKPLAKSAARRAS